LATEAIAAVVDEEDRAIVLAIFDKVLRREVPNGAVTWPDGLVAAATQCP
jgi:hypothetical protein